jgi:peptidoglycan/xylan/chitin deacetylase (PgdA/CDA1 family)
MRIPILTYHSNNILGENYALNDHIALAEDLALLKRLGVRVVSLRDAVRGLDEGGDWQQCVAITFDDGSWFDWHDMPHPSFGMQPGFRRILREAGATGTAFVIASPAARDELDRTCLIGKGWWDDAWWPMATREGVIAIENHSWDHNHSLLASTVLGDRPKGGFTCVDDAAAARDEIDQAADYLDAHCAPHRSTLFAYPYGECPDFLAEEYFPRLQHRVRAAFSTDPEPMSRDCNRWRIGRYVCGYHWKSGEDLVVLLSDAFGTSLPAA